MVVLGLAAARRLGLDAGGDHPESALEKIHRVLPTTLRRRVEALEAAVAFTSSDTAGVPVDAEVLLLVSDAIRRRHRLRTSYTSFSGERSERELSPYGLVVHSGRWYLAAHDHGREALRTFRVDRMAAVSMTPASARDGPGRVRRSRPRGALARERALAMGGRGDPRAPARGRRPRGSRRRSPSSSMRTRGSGRVLRMRVDSLDWMASVLAGLGCDFTVVQPAELRRASRRSPAASRSASDLRFTLQTPEAHRTAPSGARIRQLLTKAQQRAHLSGVP